MAKLRIIGDVHQHYDAYLPIAQEANYSLQIGDMGFDYTPIEILDGYHHKFIMGNHDNYDNHPWNALSLYGNDGFSKADFLFFYVRGAFSIDWRQRQEYYLKSGVKTYWDNEELNMTQMSHCFKIYKTAKPDLVITHDCPRSIAKRISNNEILKRFGYNPETFSTRTSELLEAMFQAHQPKRWIFGHHHINWNSEINGTHFTCLDELSYMDLEI